MLTISWTSASFSEWSGTDIGATREDEIAHDDLIGELLQVNRSSLGVHQFEAGRWLVERA
jgi:hypothetical protein